MSNWTTIESDPGVFTEMIKSFGVADIVVEELYSLDDIGSNDNKREQSKGLIFLFKWRDERNIQSNSIILDPQDVPALFFAQQVITNACATQAILNILFNAEDIKLGDTLSEFKSFVDGFDSESKGLAIGNSDLIRNVHNSFARAEPFMHEESSKSSDKSEDVYHFIAYIPFEGTVYELDGLKSGPILLGEYGTNANWLTIAKPALEERMARYSASETHFALLSVCESKTSIIEAEISTINQQISTSIDETFINMSQQNIQLLQEELGDENAKLERQLKENIRRRHNYIPFIISLIRTLASKNKLEDMIAAGVERNNNNINKE